MKTVTFSIALVICLTAIADFALAQEKLDALMNDTTPEERAQLQTDYMKESLSLTPDQESKILNLNIKYAKQMQAAYNAPDRKFQKLKKMKAINGEKDLEIKNVLSSEQYATYEKNREEMKEKMRARAKERRKTKD